MKLKESIFDFPTEGLNPQLWRQTEDGSFALREDVESKIMQIVDWAQQTFKIPDMRVNITGSSTSNSYSSSSDIDIHFNSPKFKKDKADEFNKIFRKAFEKFIAMHPELESINGVRTEIYMQPNPFQDYMSVGCYDFLNRTWLVGPELKDQSFDPYAEYFLKDMKSVDDLIDNVRSLILQLYELSIAVLKTKDNEFKDKVGKKFLSTLKKARSLFTVLRKRRKIKSTPKDIEDAMKFRKSKEWQIADSSFKLLDKFGYLKLLQQAAKSSEENDTPEVAAQKFIDLITQKISSKSLDDSEKMFIGQLLEFEPIDESLGSMLKLSALASLMSIGSFLPMNALAKELSKAYAKSSITNQTFNKDSTAVKTAIQNAAKDKTMLGAMSKTNVVNAVAQTLWKEARGESTEGRDAIASIILNRTGNDPTKIVDVLKQKKAFSCYNAYTGGWTDKTYKWFLPYKEISSNASSKDIWDECNNTALKLVDKKFKSTIGNRNAYLNKATADKDAVNTWGKKCTLKVGKHHFGYLPEHDPKYVVPGTMVTWKDWNKAHGSNKVVVVKPGDTLGKIAKDAGTTLQNLIALNGIKNPNRISIGQKLKIN